MREDVLFSDDEFVGGGPDDGGDVYTVAPRVRVAVRNQVELVETDLEGLVAGDHQVRLVWGFVEQQDLSALYDLIRARGARPGRCAIDPKILMALWINAVLDGVGSARELERRCREDIGYRWICGGVSVNYHTLADFRVNHLDVFDEMLSRNVASLMAEGLVEMDRVALDGMRVRASVGGASYRRRPTLERCYEEAKEQVATLREELKGDRDAGGKRSRAARMRAAKEREGRLAKALDNMKKLEEREEAKSPSQRKEKKKLRVSMTDPDTQVMKMADGGYRPANNVQLAADTETRIITGVDMVNVGSDHGLIPPMLDQHIERYDKCPGEILVDGGFSKHEDIDLVAKTPFECTVYAPVYKPTKSGIDPYQPKSGDSKAVAQWRKRMGTEQGKTIYKQRAATIEWVNAQARNRGLRQFTVRTLKKVKAALLWYVLAHNMMRTHKLKPATA